MLLPTVPPVPRLVLLGAAGRTGRSVAARAVELGHRPVLAARDASAVARLAHELAPDDPLDVLPLDVAVDPAALERALEPGDVVVSTLPSLSGAATAGAWAAVRAGASHVDCGVQPSHLLRLVLDVDPVARGRCAVLPATGLEAVPGVLAAALALRDAGPAAQRVHVGYFRRGRRPVRPSSAALATLSRSAPGTTFRHADGRLRGDAVGPRVVRFDLCGGPCPALTVSGFEHLALPADFPGLRTVEVAVGWPGHLCRPLQVAARVAAATGPLGASGGHVALSASRRVRSAAAPAGTLARGVDHRLRPDVVRRRADNDRRRDVDATRVVAETFDAAGQRLSVVQLVGGQRRDVTARLLAWTGARLLRGDVAATGVLGPVAAFGLDALVVGVAEAGLSQA